MCLSIAYFGHGLGEVVEAPILAGATAILLVLTIIAMFKIDWEKLVTKHT